MTSERFHIIEAPRPEEGSPEDIQHGLRCAALRAAIARMGQGILPGSPALEDELRAMVRFGELVLEGCAVEEALWRVRYERNAARCQP